MLWLIIISAIILILLIIGIHEKSTNAIYRSSRRLDGRTVIVTGGTAGMGIEIAVDLAQRGARVIIACPFHDEGTKAEEFIKRKTKNEKVIFKHLDLGSLRSVREFADDILKTEERLDILLNNAGVGIPGDFATSDGLHFIMQVNYYGTFLLTLLLLPLLKKTGIPEEPSRILTTASFLHLIAYLDLPNLNETGHWFKVQIYGNSKLCLVLFTRELAKMLDGTNVVVNCLDPGLVATRIYYSVNVVYGIFMKILLNLLFKTTWQGAQTALYAVLDKKAGEVSGEYFKNCGTSWHVRRPDEETSRLLWEDSVRRVKLKDDELQRCF